jgi:hypothetical protein
MDPLTHSKVSFGIGLVFRVHASLYHLAFQSTQSTMYYQMKSIH